MNERLQELLDESGLIKYTKIVVPEYEKFAELIVKECADVGSKLSLAHPEDIRHQIKKHFGIKQ
jgi:hypothetical protein